MRRSRAPARRPRGRAALLLLLPLATPGAPTTPVRGMTRQKARATAGDLTPGPDEQALWGGSGVVAGIDPGAAGSRDPAPATAPTAMHRTPTDEHGHLEVVPSVQAAPGPPFSIAELQAPIQGPPAALAAASASGPGAQAEAFEGARAET